MRYTKLIAHHVMIIVSVAAVAPGVWSGESKPPGSPPRAMRLDVTRDTWVSDVGQEVDGNNGGASRLKLKSFQEMSLVDVDAAPLRGWVIQSATLHLRKAGNEPLRRVTVSGVGAEWFEGTGSGYAV